MEVVKHGRNVHELQLSGKQIHVAMLSDLHWDNPKCDRELLKRHLDFCKENNIPVVVNGDFFCLMEGRGDNRRSRNILPEHNNAVQIPDHRASDITEMFEVECTVFNECRQADGGQVTHSRFFGR